MITFNYETKFSLKDEVKIENWINVEVSVKGFEIGESNYVFCDDAYLLKLNVEFLQHDTLTDIISFDNCLGKLLNGDIYISIERVKDNANYFDVSFDDELHRVMIHGVLHYMGFKDKSDKDKQQMREAENKALSSISN